MGSTGHQERRQALASGRARPPDCGGPQRHERRDQPPARLARELASARPTRKRARTRHVAATGEQLSARVAIALQAEGVQSVSYAAGRWQCAPTIRTPRPASRASTSPRACDLDAARWWSLPASRASTITANHDPRSCGSDTRPWPSPRRLRRPNAHLHRRRWCLHHRPARRADARRLLTVSFEEMLEMASWAPRCCRSARGEFAGKYKVPLRVLSSFTPWDIDSMKKPIWHADHFEEDLNMEQAVRIRHRVQPRRAKISVLACPTRRASRTNPRRGGRCEHRSRRDHQNLSKDGKTDFSFTVNRNDYAKATDCSRPRCCRPWARRDRRRNQESARSASWASACAPCGRREQDVPRTERRGHQHPDDLDQRNQDLRRDRREVHGAGRACIAPAFDLDSQRPETLQRRHNPGFQRNCDRVAEGAPLLREYGV